MKLLWSPHCESWGTHNTGPRWEKPRGNSTGGSSMLSALLSACVRLTRARSRGGRSRKAVEPEMRILIATSLRGIVGGIETYLQIDRKSTRLNSSHLGISYAVFCLKKKKQTIP